MIHLVQFSTGIGSAEVAYRAVERYGLGNVLLLTADTRREDADNWRFAREVWEDLGRPVWEVIADGRTPMEVGRDERCVPNNRMAVCSKILKIDLIRSWLEDNYDPADVVMHLGLDWSEAHRIDGRMVQGKWRPGTRERWSPWVTGYLLTEPPLVEKPRLLQNSRDRGIEPPRLYADGFSHANCGGACVRGGQAQWELLLRTNRPRYLEWEGDEEETRAMLGKDVAILRDRRGGAGGRPLSLRAFRERLDRSPAMFDDSDWGACGCTDDPPDDNGTRPESSPVSYRPK